MGKLIVVLPVVSYFQGQEAREGWGGGGRGIGCRGVQG